MKIIKQINRCDIFVGIWALYNLQNILYSQGIINQILQLIMILWLLKESYPVFTQDHQPRLITATKWLLAMYIVYGVALMMFPPVRMQSGAYTYLQSALSSLLPIFMFYLYCINGILTEKRMQLYLIVFIPIVFLVSQYNIQQQLAAAMSNRTEFTDNTGYMYLALLPLVGMYYKKPLLQYLLFAVLFILILNAMKRGAIIIAVLCLLMLIYTNYKKTNSVKNRVLIILLSVLALAASFYYFEYMLANSDYFLQRFESTLDGNTSNRDVLFAGAWNGFWNETNIFKILFGHGACSTYSDIGNYAHQDWLESLYCNGIVGVFILLTFFISFLKIVIERVKHSDSALSATFVMLIAICFSKTLFSMSIMNLEISQTMLMGYMIALTSNPDILSRRS